MKPEKAERARARVVQGRRSMAECERHVEGGAGMTTGIVIGLTTVGAVSIWLWRNPKWGTARSGPRGRWCRLAATVLAGENQTAPQRRVIHPLPIPKPLAAAWPSHLDVVPSPATPLALVLETQVTAQSDV